jgi:hypothetical protein
MNRKQLQKHVGETRRLRPTPTDAAGTEVDDLWTVSAADDEGLQLHNQRTDQVLQLGYDHILEYRTPDFLILKSTISFQPHGLKLEPIVAPPKVTLEVAMPLPEPTKRPDGSWSQEIQVHPTRPDNVPNATVEIKFHEPYRTGAYEVVRTNPTQAMFIQELFGVEGRNSSNQFRMGLVELPRGTWLRFVFTGNTAPRPSEIRLTPYFKQ